MLEDAERRDCWFVCTAPAATWCSGEQCPRADVGWPTVTFTSCARRADDLRGTPPWSCRIGVNSFSAGFRGCTVAGTSCRRSSWNEMHARLSLPTHRLLQMDRVQPLRLRPTSGIWCTACVVHRCSGGRDRPSSHDLSSGQALSTAYQVSSLARHTLAGKSLTRPSTFGGEYKMNQRQWPRKCRSLSRNAAQWPISSRRRAGVSWCRAISRCGDRLRLLAGDAQRREARSKSTSSGRGRVSSRTNEWGARMGC